MGRTRGQPHGWEGEAERWCAPAIGAGAVSEGWGSGVPRVNGTGQTEGTCLEDRAEAPRSVCARAID